MSVKSLDTHNIYIYMYVCLYIWIYILQLTEKSASNWLGGVSKCSCHKEMFITEYWVGAHNLRSDVYIW